MNENVIEIYYLPHCVLLRFYKIQNMRPNASPLAPKPMPKLKKTSRQARASHLHMNFTQFIIVFQF